MCASPESPPPEPERVGPDALVARAQAHVAAQAGISAEDALAVMHARAASSDLSLMYVARAIVDGHIRFDA